MKVFHFLSAQYGMAAVRTRCLKVARFHDLNDPFELYAAELSNPGHRAMFQALKLWASDRFGLVCFCRKWSNPLLWSHYGDKHCGVALELSVHPDDICEVTYTPKRLLIDVKKRSREGGFSEDDAYQLATTKFRHWKYEDEVRVFTKLSECRVADGMHFEPFGNRMKLVGMILGPTCNLTHEEICTALPQDEELQVTKARLAFTSFSVVRNRKIPIAMLRGAAQQGAPGDGPRPASSARP